MSSTTSGFRPRHHRRILCVQPPTLRTFGTLHHVFPLVPGVKGFLPPLGLLTVAGFLPREWEVRLVDETVHGPVDDASLSWADVVLVGGMTPQRAGIETVLRRARAHGKTVVLGGPAVTADPGGFPGADLLHLGELGEATLELLERLDRSTARPDRQEVFATRERLPFEQMPTPDWSLIRTGDYLLASVQWSSGCPHGCEFCAVPLLAGRVPRHKQPAQVLAELDAILARGNPHAIHFVDDNFVGRPELTAALLDELIRWQERRGFPVQFNCEATLSLAEQPEILRRMRQAGFTTVFCGIESVEDRGQQTLSKGRQLKRPLLEDVRTLNAHGLEVVAGIIFGLDTDGPETGDRVLEFIQASQIPMLTLNVLHALPGTPLWQRLEREGRLRPGEEATRGTNVEFLLPHEQVVSMWQRCIAEAYAPEAVYGRYRHQLRHTFPHRRPLPLTRARVNPAALRQGLAILGRLLVQVGLRAAHRRSFWKLALPGLARLELEQVIYVSLAAHHLIRYARDCALGRGELSFYA